MSPFHRFLELIRREAVVVIRVDLVKKRLRFVREVFHIEFDWLVGREEAEAVRVERASQPILAQPPHPRGA